MNKLTHIRRALAQALALRAVRMVDSAPVNEREEMPLARSIVIVVLILCVTVLSGCSAEARVDGLALFLLGACFVCIIVLTAIALIYVNRWRRVPAPPQAPEPARFYPPFPPVINVTHHHYPGSIAPPQAPAPSLPVEWSGWTIARKAEHLIRAGYSMEDARAMLESEHRAAPRLPKGRF